MKASAAFLCSFLLVFSFPAFAAADSSSAACTDLPSDLSLGARDDASGSVTALQQYLKSGGYLAADATGYFGAQTQAAVAAFQSANGISAIGVAGPATRAKMKALSCGDTSSDGPSLGTVFLPLSVGCAATFYQAAPGQPVTWDIYFSGGVEPYSYSFSDSVGGSARGTASADIDSSVAKTYGGKGTVTAKVIAKSADGEKVSADCGSVAISQDPSGAQGSGPTFDSFDSGGSQNWYDSFFNVGSWFGTSYFDGFFPPDQPLDNAPLDNGTPPDSSCAAQNGCLSSDPFITNLSSSEAGVGDALVITGIGFTGHNAIAIGDNAQFPGEVASPDGTTLTVQIPSSLGALCAFKVGVACSRLAEPFSPGSYDLSVVTLGTDGVIRVSPAAYFTIVQ